MINRILVLLLAFLVFLLPPQAFAAVSVAEAGTEVASSVDDTTYAMGAIASPTADAVYVVMVQAAQTVATGSMSGGGLTWNKITSVPWNGGVDTIYAFYAVTGSSPGSMTPTFDCTGDGATGVVMSAVAITGANVSNPIRQTGSNTGTTQDPVITFSQNLQTANAYLYHVSTTRNPPGNSHGSFTEIADTGHTSPARGGAAAYKATGETGTTITATLASTTWGILGIEVCEASNCVVTGGVLNHNNVRAAGPNYSGGVQ